MKHHLLWALLAAVLLAACDGTPTAPADSGIEGTVLLGPTCPVIQEGHEEECADRPYAADIIILNAAGREVATAHSDDTGHFRVNLAPGDYLLHPLTPAGSPFPVAGDQSVPVAAGQFAQVTILYDTGIR